MSTTEAQDLLEAIDRCADEPIHIPGSIQPHGFLLVVSEPDLRIQQASENVRDWLDVEADLKLEYKVRGALCKGIELCELHKDYISRDILRAQLADTEEDHTYWLEKQQGLIKAIGLENYLQSQM